MEPDTSVAVPNRRDSILSAATYFVVSLIPLPFLTWAILRTHNFRDLSASNETATAASLNAFGLMAGLIVSSAFIGRAVASFIQPLTIFKLISYSVLVGVLWSIPTFFGAWAALAIHGAINHDFTLLRNAFTLEEVASGFVVLPILLNIPLATLSAFLVKKLVFRSSTTA